MILLPQLKQVLDQAVASIPELKKSILIVGEEHLRKKLSGLSREKDFPLLVALIPSGDGQGTDWDSAQYRNELDFFLLTKCSSYTSRTEEEEFQDFVDMQTLTIKFKDHVLSPQSISVCSWFSKVDPNGFSWDPEFNYMGCDGYSTSFYVLTK